MSDELQKIFFSAAFFCLLFNTLFSQFFHRSNTISSKKEHNLRLESFSESGIEVLSDADRKHLWVRIRGHTH